MTIAPLPAPRRPATTAPVLRRCACGRGAGAGGECAECRRKRVRDGASSSARSAEPGSAHGLDTPAGVSADQRWGFSFADVPVHARTGASGAGSAGWDAPPSTGARLYPRLEVGAVDAPGEREAERAAERVAGGGHAGPIGAASPLPLRLARAPGAAGAGASAAAAEAPCPSPDDERALYCPFAGRSDDEVNCRMGPAMVAVLAEARTAARERVGRAVQRMTNANAAQRALITRLARSSFADQPPAYDAILTRLTTIQGLLAGTAMVGAACDDHTCYSGGTLAYVSPTGQPPVHVCMRSFSPPNRHRLAGTLIHETAHVAGAITADARTESYCESAACGERCFTPEHADSWRHFADCFGAGPLVRTDFNRETVRSVEEGL
jgi:hypothetical protein